MCTFSVFDDFQRAQLICDNTTCRFSDCTRQDFQDFSTLCISTTCHFNSCSTENISDQLLHCQQSLLLCSTHTIQQVCVDVLRNNHPVLREICPHPRTVLSEMCTGSPLIDSQTPITTPASIPSSNIILSNTNEEGRPGKSLIVTSLGVLVGMLVVLLAVVTTGWVCTCWTMRQRERNKTNSEQVRYTIAKYVQVAC